MSLTFNAPVDLRVNPEAKLSVNAVFGSHSDFINAQTQKNLTMDDNLIPAVFKPNIESVSGIKLLDGPKPKIDIFENAIL